MTYYHYYYRVGGIITIITDDGVAFYGRKAEFNRTGAWAELFFIIIITTEEVEDNN